MNIINYEKGGRGVTCEAILRAFSPPLPFEKIVLLPIPTTRDGRTLTGTDIDIASVTKKSDTGTVFVGYGIPTWAKEDIKKRGGEVLDCEEDEIFLEGNGRLTAEGILGVILTTSEKSVSDLAVGVVGYGRIGKMLSHMLLTLGCHIRVYTSKKSVQMDLCECAVDCRESCAEADLSGLDILVNTAPHPIFPIERLPRGLRVMELASGDNFLSSDGGRAEKSASFDSLSAKIERYPSLPSVMYPESAGVLWAHSVLRGVGAE